MAAAGAADAGLRERDEHDEKVRWFHDFLHSNRDEWEKRIDTELANNLFRVPLELRDLKKADPTLDRRLLESPVKFLVPWEEALLKFVAEINPKAVKQLKKPLRLDVRGAFGRNYVTPRGMTSITLHQLVMVRGIVSKVSASAPKLLQSMHVRKNAEDGHVETRDHRDQTSFVSSSSAGAMPTHDQDGNELSTEVGLSVYKDYQRFIIQETPEQTPPGQIPRCVEVICEGDLVDKAKPGDRVEVTGVYRSFPPTDNKDITNGIFPARVIATNVVQVKELLEQPFVPNDVRNIREIAARPDAFELLARSFAPSICGHEKVKAGLLLLMIGGTEKNLSNGTHLRGDINVLLVGDPSCGKSQMLRFVMNIAPLAISTTGKGASGVGLTAAVTREPGSRDFTLEAGAMVLADRGIICIDEFDKMGVNDRVAIHEAMEQQCVTIAKAGMHVTLNARCSVVAAANPVYGSFDSSMDLAKNINLPDSLLSRFDLVFVVRDLTTEEIDRKIADQVLRQAMQRMNNEGGRRGVEQVHSSILERRQEADPKKQQEATEVFAKAPPRADGTQPPEVLTVDFLSKYLRYCRRLTPVLTPEAQAVVAEKYVDMRMRFQSGFLDTSGEDKGSKKPRLAVTTRTLEALIRLATAHAKLKLRKDHVLEEDVVEAYKLMLSAREEELPPQREAEPAAIEASQISAHAAQPSKKRGRDPQDSTLEDTAGTETQSSMGVLISDERIRILKELVGRAFAQQRTTDIEQGMLLELVNSRVYEGEPTFLEDEFLAGLERLEATNKVMLAEGRVISVD